MTSPEPSTGAPGSTSTRPVSPTSIALAAAATVDLDPTAGQDGMDTTVKVDTRPGVDLDPSTSTGPADGASPLLWWALTYAAGGLPVVPLHTPTGPASCSCRRSDCKRIGKHPRTVHGLSEATTDPGQITAWWTRWPDANIGGLTGVVFDVCDVDGSAGVDAVRDRLDAASHRAAPLVRTGSGGWHLFFAPTGHGNRTGMLPDVDWRGVRGYVVLPPSLHASGHRYAWVRSAPVLPTVPGPLLAVLAPPTIERRPGGLHVATKRFGYGSVALDNEVRELCRAREGQRNHVLNRAAYSLGQLVATGDLAEQAVTDTLTATALGIGLEPAEVVRTIASGLAAGMRNPRSRSARRVASGVGA